jgi:hypothetical protein
VVDGNVVGDGIGTVKNNNEGGATATTTSVEATPPLILPTITIYNTQHRTDGIQHHHNWPHSTCPMKRTSRENYMWPLREGPPDHRPNRPPKNFFFRIFLVKTKDHIKKLLNPKYEAFLTIL